jgi:hypothetical protein
VEDERLKNNKFTYDLCMFDRGVKSCHSANDVVTVSVGQASERRLDMQARCHGDKVESRPLGCNHRRESEVSSWNQRHSQARQALTVVCPLMRASILIYTGGVVLVIYGEAFTDEMFRVTFTGAPTDPQVRGAMTS